MEFLMIEQDGPVLRIPLGEHVEIKEGSLPEEVV